MNYIKNIEHESALCLKDEVSVQAGQIVSKTLAQNPHVSITLFAFSKGEEISSHDSSGDAMFWYWKAQGSSPWMVLNTF